jgi:NADPH:quinone reductase-like Zn-dependent oxidoreductase
VRVTQGVRTAERLGRYADLYATGKLKFPVRRTYELDRAADAHREIEARHGSGKIVLRIG